MTRIPDYNSNDVIHQAEHRAAPYAGVDLRNLLRAAFIVEDGLRAYLHTQCRCAFAEFPQAGTWSLISTGGKDQGKSLYRGADFLAMLEIALARKENTV